MKKHFLIFIAVIAVVLTSLWAYADNKDELMKWNKAIELDPRYEEAYSSRGLVYALMGRYEEALEDFNKAIELEPRYAGAYHNRAIAYYYLNDHKKSIENYKIAAKLGNKKAQDFLRKKGYSW